MRRGRGEYGLIPSVPFFAEQAHESLAMRCGGDAGAGGDAGVGGDEDAAARQAPGPGDGAELERRERIGGREGQAAGRR
ncbi:hypothetical protein G6F32_016696 [Rhizopus arrhizus]|nr:hypothetical protein G6F32_016696 [Rhizopus arrhizus]